MDFYLGKELHTVRNVVRESLPAYVFEPQPIRGIVAISLIPVVIFLSWAIIYYSPPWYACLPLSIIIGHIFTAWGFIAHEALHGAIFKSNLGQNLLGYLGYIPFLISPLTWKFWHCQCHHGYTNFVEKDPDFVGTLEGFSKNFKTRLRAMFTPGTHHWFSYIGLFCLFTLEGQYVLWCYEVGSEIESKFRFNRIRAQIETILMVFSWLFVGIIIGLKASFYLIIFPMLIGNFIYVSYILTQHLLRPVSSNVNNPLGNTLTATIHPFLAFFHLHFGYHVEHHLFPSMSHQFGPMVSQVLREHFGEQYVAIPYLKAFYYVLRTPRIHYDSETLMSPFSGKQVKLSDVIAEMMQ